MTPRRTTAPDPGSQTADAGRDRTERTAAIIAAAGTATFARAAGGRVLGINGDGHGDPEVEIVNTGAFECFDGIEFNTAYADEAEIRCAMVAQVCTAMAGTAAVKIADLGSAFGLYDSAAVGKSMDREDALLARFLPFAGVHMEDEGILREEFAHFVREVVGKNWLTVVDTANEVAHLGGINGERVNGFRELQYPCPVTPAAAHALFARVVERGDDWKEDVEPNDERAPKFPPTRHPAVREGWKEQPDAPGMWLCLPEAGGRLLAKYPAGIMVEVREVPGGKSDSTGGGMRLTAKFFDVHYSELCRGRWYGPISSLSGVARKLEMRVAELIGPGAVERELATP